MTIVSCEPAYRHYLWLSTDKSGSEKSRKIPKISEAVNPRTAKDIAKGKKLKDING